MRNPKQSAAGEPAAAASRAAAAGKRPSSAGHLQLRFERDPSAPAAARAATTDWCRELAVDESRFDNVRLLVSEVVSNAVRHSQGPAEAPIHLSGSIVEDTIRIAVSDAGEGFTPRPRDPSRIIGGYGLLLLERMASRWGVERAGGTCVWFEL